MMPPSPCAGFACVATALPDELCRRMVGASWHPGPRCPPFAALRLLTLRHWDFAGAVQTGQLVVGGAVAGELEAIFAGLFALGFPIARMQPIDVFAGDDDASMAANNTS